MASAFAPVPGTTCSCGRSPVSAKKDFCSARRVVSILTCALSFFVSDTYPLVAVFCADIPAARIAPELLKSPEREADCLKQRREACRNEVEAILDMLLIVKIVVRSDETEPEMEMAKYVCNSTPFDIALVNAS